MPKKIAGITIEIGADTTQLKKSLASSDSSIKKTQASLRDMNKLLKLDPSNTVLLQQKQKALETQIGNTKDRLRILHDEQNKLAGKERTEEEQKQFELIQREIIDTENKLKSLTKEMRDFGSVGAQKIAAVGAKFEEIGGKIKSVGGKIEGVGNAMLPVTAAIIGAGAAAVKSWQEVDDAADAVIKKTGATGDELDDLQRRMQNIATTIPTTFEIAGDALGEVYTRFDITGDACEELSTRFIKFADLNKTDVSSSIDTVQKSMAAWNVDAKDAGLFLDMLNRISQKTGVGALQVAQSITTNAASLKELGFSASDSAVFLADLDKNGVDAAAAMTGLKKAYAAAVKDGSDLSANLADLENRLRNNETHADAAGEAIKLFGAKAGGALIDAVTSGRMSFSELGTAMTDFAGSVESTFEATLDPLDEVKTMMNEVKTAGADLVDAAGPLIKDVLGSAKTAIEKTTSALKKMSPEEKQQIIKIAGITAAIGPLLIAGGKTIKLIGGATEGVGKVLQYAPKVVSALKAGKAGLLALGTSGGIAVAAIAGVGAAVFAVVKHYKDYVKATYGLTDAQKEAIAKQHELVQAYSESTTARIEENAGINTQYDRYHDLYGELQTLIDSEGKVKDGMQDRVSFIVGELSNALGIEIEMSDGVVKINKDIADSIDTIIEKRKAEAILEANKDAYMEAVKGQSDALAQHVSDLDAVSAAEQKLSNLESEYAHNLSMYQEAVKNGLDGDAYVHDMQLIAEEMDAQKKTIDELKGAAADSAEVYYGFLDTIGDYETLENAAISGEGLAAAIKGMTEEFVTADKATQQMLDNQAKNYREKYEAMKRAAESGMGTVTDEELRKWKELSDRATAEARKGGTDAGAALAQGVRNKQEEARMAGQALTEGVKAGAESVDLFATGENAGGMFGKGLVRGMNSWRTPVAEAATGLASTIPSTARITMQISSPSKIATKYGAFWGEGLVNGLKRMITPVSKASATLSSAVITSPASPAMMNYPQAQRAAMAPSVTVNAPAANNSGILRALELIYNRLDRLEVTLDGKALVGAITPGVNRSLANRAQLEAMGVV